MATRGVNDNQFFCSLLQSQQAISNSLSVGGGAAIHNNPHAPGVGGICALVEEAYQVALGNWGNRDGNMLEPMILHKFGGMNIRNYQLLSSYLPAILIYFGHDSFFVIFCLWIRICEFVLRVFLSTWKTCWKLELESERHAGQTFLHTFEGRHMNHDFLSLPEIGTGISSQNQSLFPDLKSVLAQLFCEVSLRRAYAIPSVQT